MKKQIIGLIAVVLAGCTSNNLVVVSPQQTQANKQLVAQNNAKKACLLPPEETTNYSIPNVLSRPSISLIPQIAKDNRIDGCASLKFQIDANGNAMNPQILREYPKGYGFADATIRGLQLSKFSSANENGQWHFYLISFVTSTMPAQPPITNAAQ